MSTSISEAVGRKWQARSGNDIVTRTVIGTRDVRGEQRYVVQTDGTNVAELIEPGFLDRQIKIDQQNVEKMQRSARADADAELEKQARYDVLRGFGARLPQARRAKMADALAVTVRNNGQLFTRADLVAQKIRAGYRVTGSGASRRLSDPGTGAFLDIKQITKTGMDFAEYLESNPQRLREHMDVNEAGAKAHYQSVMNRGRVPAIDPDEYPPIAGMEGPFRFKGGRILYYDRRYKGGRYYDRKKDMYLGRDEDPAESIGEDRLDEAPDNPVRATPRTGDLAVESIGNELRIYVFKTDSRMRSIAHSNTIFGGRAIHYNTLEDAPPEQQKKMRAQNIQRTGGSVPAKDFTVARVYGGKRTKGQTLALMRQYFGHLMTPKTQVHVYYSGSGPSGTSFRGGYFTVNADPSRIIGDKPEPKAKPPQAGATKVPKEKPYIIPRMEGVDEVMVSGTDTLHDIWKKSGDDDDADEAAERAFFMAVARALAKVLRGRIKSAKIDPLDTMSAKIGTSSGDYALRLDGDADGTRFKLQAPGKSTLGIARDNLSVNKTVTTLLKSVGESLDESIKMPAGTTNANYGYKAIEVLPRNAKPEAYAKIAKEARNAGAGMDGVEGMFYSALYQAAMQAETAARKGTAYGSPSDPVVKARGVKESLSEGARLAAAIVTGQRPAAAPLDEAASFPKKKLSTKDPMTMRPAEIEKELKTLSDYDSKLGDWFIDNGRGHEKYSDSRVLAAKGDPAAAMRLALADRFGELRDEIRARTGGMTSFPPAKKGSFGPRKKMGEDMNEDRIDHTPEPRQLSEGASMAAKALGGSSLFEHRRPLIEAEPPKAPGKSFAVSVTLEKEGRKMEDKANALAKKHGAGEAKWGDGKATLTFPNEGHGRAFVKDLESAIGPGNFSYDLEESAKTKTFKVEQQNIADFKAGKLKGEPMIWKGQSGWGSLAVMARVGPNVLVRAGSITLVKKHLQDAGIDSSKFKLKVDPRVASESIDEAWWDQPTALLTKFVNSAKAVESNPMESTMNEAKMTPMSARKPLLKAMASMERIGEPMNYRSIVIGFSDETGMSMVGAGHEIVKRALNLLINSGNVKKVGDEYRVVSKVLSDPKDRKLRESLDEKSPPGFEGTVKAMKKKGDIDNPYALAWSMKKKGYKSHYTKDGKPKQEAMDNDWFDSLDEADQAEFIEETVIDDLEDLVIRAVADAPNDFAEAIRDLDDLLSEGEYELAWDVAVGIIEEADYLDEEQLDELKKGYRFSAGARQKMARVRRKPKTGAKLRDLKMRRRENRKAVNKLARKRFYQKNRSRIMRRRKQLGNSVEATKPVPRIEETYLANYGPSNPALLATEIAEFLRKHPDVTYGELATRFKVGRDVAQQIMLQAAKFTGSKGASGSFAKHIMGYMPQVGAVAMPRGESIEEATPNWPGADAVYGNLGRVLDMMSKSGHATAPKVHKRTRKILKPAFVSDEMRDLIDAMNRGNEEKLKGLQMQYRNRYPAAFKESIEEGWDQAQQMLRKAAKLIDMNKFEEADKLVRQAAKEHGVTPNDLTSELGKSAMSKMRKWTKAKKTKEESVDEGFSDQQLYDAAKEATPEHWKAFRKTAPDFTKLSEKHQWMLMGATILNGQGLDPAGAVQKFASYVAGKDSGSTPTFEDLYRYVTMVGDSESAPETPVVSEADEDTDSEVEVGDPLGDMMDPRRGPKPKYRGQVGAIPDDVQTEDEDDYAFSPLFEMDDEEEEDGEDEESEDSEDEPDDEDDMEEEDAEETDESEDLYGDDDRVDEKANSGPLSPAMKKQVSDRAAKLMSLAYKFAPNAADARNRLLKLAKSGGVDTSGAKDAGEVAMRIARKELMKGESLDETMLADEVDVEVAESNEDGTLLTFPREQSEELIEAARAVGLAAASTKVRIRDGNVEIRVPTEKVADFNAKMGVA